TPCRIRCWSRLSRRLMAGEWVAAHTLTVPALTHTAAPQIRLNILSLIEPPVVVYLYARTIGIDSLRSKRLKARGSTKSMEVPLAEAGIAWSTRNVRLLSKVIV